jgi:hypothetical protein
MLKVKPLFEYHTQKESCICLVNNYIVVLHVLIISETF